MTMRGMLPGVVIVLSAVLGAGVPLHAIGASVDCREKAKAFLSTPNDRTLRAVSGVVAEACWTVIFSSEAKRGRLIHSVERGNRWAAQYLADHLSNLDGGELEDSLIALGQFADRHPERLLVFVKEGHLADYNLKSAMIMFPLSLGESPGAQLDALKARRQRIKGVTRADLAQQKLIALQAIDADVKEMQLIRSRLRKK